MHCLYKVVIFQTVSYEYFYVHYEYHTGFNTKSRPIHIRIRPNGKWIRSSFIGIRQWHR